MTRPRPDARDKETVELSLHPELGVTDRLGLLVLAADQVSTVLLPASGEVTIGRARDADVTIDAESLSRRHAVLQLGPPLRIKDLGSSNGTRVRDQAVGADWVDLQPGEAIQLGSVTVLVQRNPAPVRAQRRLWSHDYFEARLEEECQRGQGSFALVRVHVDGPRATEAASELTFALAPTDCLAAYAPGEFEALLFGTGADEAASRAAELVESLAEHGLSARVGVACFPASGRDPERLVAVANGQLTRAPAETSAPGVVIESAAMRQLYSVIDRIAAGSISVLVTGETGVGKEVVAAALHQKSPRAKKTYLTLNCAAFTETLLESELFGHEKGSFTGATDAKQGLLESANGGTVFLDEVGELPMSTQVKLLRVLEEKAVRRVGSLKSRPIDARFVTATNRDLEAEVTAGRFRQDLYFRIAGVTLVVPPLRERSEELEALAKAFIAQAAEQLGRRAPALAKGTLDLLGSYRWPGNIRELRNMMERAVLLCGGTSIEPEHLPREKLSAVWVSPPGAAPASGPDGEERARIADALAQCGGNQTRAAKLLGISRRTLLYRLDAMGLARPQKKPT